MNSTLAGILIILAGGFLNGTFALFLKNLSKWRWENFWLIFSFSGLLFFPFLWTYFSVPGLEKIFELIPPQTLTILIISGFLWGIGNILFGLSTVKIGQALTFTIVLGLTTLLGSIIPLFLNPTALSLRSLLFLSLGLAVITSGTILSGYAGFIREKIKSKEPKNSSGSYLSGISMALTSGILSSMINIGFASGQPVSSLAVNFGASSSNATLPVMFIILFGGFFANSSFALYLLFKNRSWNLYNKNPLKSSIGATASGLFLYGSLALYGIGSSFIGSLGTSVGFAIFLSFVIITGNTWGIITREWENAAKGLKLQLLSMLILITGILLISSSTFNPPEPQPSPSPSPSVQIDETKEIMDAANNSFPDGKIQGIESEIKFNKQLGDYARLSATATKQTLDPLTIIIQKKDGKWSVLNFGTSFPDLEEKLPELFKD